MSICAEHAVAVATSGAGVAVREGFRLRGSSATGCAEGDLGVGVPGGGIFKGAAARAFRGHVVLRALFILTALPICCDLRATRNAPIAVAFAQSLRDPIFIGFDFLRVGIGDATVHRAAHCHGERFADRADFAHRQFRFAQLAFAYATLDDFFDVRLQRFRA